MKKTILSLSSVAAVLALLNCGEDAATTDGSEFLTGGGGSSSSTTSGSGAPSGSQTDTTMTGTTGTTDTSTTGTAPPTGGTATTTGTSTTATTGTTTGTTTGPETMTDDGAADDSTADDTSMVDDTTADDTSMVDDTTADDTSMVDDTAADDTGMEGMGGMGGEDPMEMPVAPVCGNGAMEEGELCDDGNLDPGDGCEADCTPTPEPEISIATLVPDLDGWIVQTPCGDTPQTDDCAGSGWSVNGGQLNVCQGGALNMDLEYPVGGEPGVVYDVAMHFYGVMEPRQYNGVEREAQGAPARSEGGTPTPWATAEPGTNYRSLGDNNYNTYEIHVYDQNDQEVKVYFLNADTGTGHYTLAISYEKTIQVYGGGKIQLVVYDANCRQIKNCGPNGNPGGDQCGNLAVSIDVSAADPNPGGGLNQPGLGQPAAHSGQWWLIDVLSVAEAAQ